MKRPLWVMSIQDDDRRMVDGLSFYANEEDALSAKREFLIVEVTEALERDDEPTAGVPAMSDDQLLDLWSEQRDGVTVEVNLHWIDF